jgi:dCTP deaminase
MSLLSYNELCELAERGVIQGVRDGAINASSIDIHLGDTVLVEDAGDVISYRNRQPLNMFERDIAERDGIIIQPGEFILASSVEVFNLPNDISCQYKLKSSMARIGLDHALAGWCDAGWNGSVLTLELKNVTRYHAIHLQAGDPIGQMVFWRHEPVPADKSYAARGRYNGDAAVSGIKL